MEKHTMFMDWKNQYCQNGYTIQSNLQIQYNPYQASFNFMAVITICSDFMPKC